MRHVKSSPFVRPLLCSIERPLAIDFDTMGDLLNNRYRLLRLLATGGMGEVFLARQEGPGGFAKTVVVKRILRHLAREQSFVDLFLNEARLAAQLQHPNVAQVFALEKDGSSWFIAMEYVHGRSLRAIIDACTQRGVRMPQRVAVRLASQALQALHFAHELKDERGRTLGVLHRDVTPENLLVSFTGIAKLVDFGIAKAMTGTSARVGLPKGKVAYMAPELTVPGAAIDRRADVYGAGVLLHEALTGERPAHLPKTVDELDLPPKPYVEREEIPLSLNRVLAKAMANSQQERWPSAEMMSEALEVWLSNDGVFHASEVADFMRQLFGTQAVEFNPSAVHFDAVPLPVDSSGVFPSPMAQVDDAKSKVPMGTTPLADSAELPTVVTHFFEDGEGLAKPAAVVRTSTPGPALMPAAQVSAPSSPSSTEVSVVQVSKSRRPAVIPVVLLAFVLLVAVGWVLLGQKTRPTVAAEKPRAAAGVATPTAVVPVVAAPKPVPVEPVVAAVEPPAVVETEPKIVPPVAPVPDKPAVDREPPAPKVVAAPKRLKMGRVSVRVNPWAEVIWSGKSYGVTPLAPFELPAGATTLTLKNSELGVTKRVPVRVLAGTMVTVKADLFESQ
jgi:eukaryotic-like serine/threonine-protein kinase